MLIKVASTDEIAPGGLKAVDLNGQEVVLCNHEGKFYAVSRRCGHMRAPLEKGTLDGVILTCPLHFAQFDITSGEALSGPQYPSSLSQSNHSVKNSDAPEKEITSLQTYRVKIKGKSILIEV